MPNTLIAQADTGIQHPPSTETSAVTEKSASSNPAAVFGLNGGLFIAQLINFAIVIFVLNRWVFKPLMKMMDERRKKIEVGIKEAAEAKEKLVSAESAKEGVVREAHVVARDIIDQAKTRAEEEHEKRARASKHIIEEQLKEAKTRADRETAESKRAAMKQISDLVIVAADKVANGAIDAKAHRELITEAIAELEHANT